MEFSEAPCRRPKQAQMKAIFLHGWQSTPGALKPAYPKDHCHEVLNPALPDDDFDVAVEIAQAEFDKHHPDVMVGSSRGGAVAMNIDSRSTPLVLLCPAWKRWGTARTVSCFSIPPEFDRRRHGSRCKTRAFPPLHRSFRRRQQSPSRIWARAEKSPRLRAENGPRSEGD